MKTLKLLLLFTLVPTFLMAQFSKVTVTGLPKFASGDAFWVDVDNDGRLDLIASGVADATGAVITDVYTNTDGAGTFLPLNAGFVKVMESTVASTDIDHDQFMDLLISGKDESGVRHTKLYRNNGNQTFTALALPIEGLSNGDAHFADFNNDGWDDIVIMGRDDANRRVTHVLLNTKTSAFEEHATILPDVSNGHLAVADFNNDLWADVVINGVKSDGTVLTEWYVNNGAGDFTKSTVSLPALVGGTLAIADYNSDGTIDLLVSGYNGDATPIWQTILMRNNSGATFVFNGTLADYTDGHAAWADFNGNGRYDLVLTGSKFPLVHATLYKDNGSGFADSGYPLPGIINGNVSWVDFNDDGKPDLFINGLPEGSSTPIGNLYQNDEAIANNAPPPPVSLSADAYDDYVALQWDAPTDAETPGAGLTYEIYVGTTPGTADAVASSSDPATGVRKVTVAGRWKKNEAFIRDLPDGEYYWSVQAIDPAGGASAFAAEQSFVVCNRLYIGEDATVCLNGDIRLSIGNTDDVVTWYNVGSPTSIGSGNDLDILITTDREIAVEVSRPLGCVVKDTVQIAMIPLPEADLGVDRQICEGEVLQLSTGSAADHVQWFDGDGQLLLDNQSSFELEVAENTTITARVESPEGCLSEDEVAVVALALPAKQLPESINVCMGEDLNVAITGAAVVNWFSEENGLLLANSPALSHQDLVQPETLWAEVKNSEGCVSNDTVDVHVLSLPEAIAGNDHLICKGETATLGGAASVLEYHWSTDEALDFSEQANPVVNPETTTTYYLRVTDANLCAQHDTVQVSLNPPSEINVGADRSICIGSSTQLGGDPTATGSQIAYNYTWSPAESLDNAFSANPVATPTQTTTYELVTRTRQCAIDTAYVTIQVDPLPVTTTSEDVTVGSGESAQLSATGGIEYEWYPGDGLSLTTVSDPVAAPMQSTRFYVLITDANGCQNTDSLEVYVRTEIFIPNLFSPNADGNNDTFRIFGTGLKSVRLAVYTIQGNLLFETHSVEEATTTGWDGRVHGAEQAVGSYLWVIEGEFYDGNRITYKGKNSGTLRLIR